MPILKIKSLFKAFGENQAVKNISFQLEKGEILAILGESGSGKTTLLQLIAALQEPDSGTLFFENKRIIPPSEKLIAGHEKIKLVRQDYGLFPNMTIRENIAYELRFYEENYRNKRVDKLLKISKLYQIKDNLPRQVSGGEQQRVVILKALAENPKLLLLDEPFSHLDSRNKEILKEEILKIIKLEEVSCIFVTHEVSDAFSVADKLVVMQKGKFLQMGKPDEIYKNPKNNYVAEITGGLALDTKNFEKIKGILNFNDKVKFLRPSQIKYNSNSSLKGIVINTKFYGFYYLVEFELYEILFRMYSFENHEIGKEIGINFELL